MAGSGCQIQTWHRDPVTRRLELENVSGERPPKGAATELQGQRSGITKRMSRSRQIFFPYDVDPAKELSWHPGMDRRDEGSIGREVKLLIPVDMGGSAAIGSKGLIHGL